MSSRVVAGGLVATGAVTWGGYAAVTWRRYGRAHRAWGRPDPLDAFIPDPEVEEDQRMRVRASAAMTFRAARELDLQRSPVVRLIFRLRSLPARLRGSSARLERVGLVEAMLGIGWGVLLDVPDEQLFVAGAVTQPWAAEVEFRPLPADEFAAFDEPGYAKIIWTLEAQALSAHESEARTRIRVKTTDAAARSRFRRYWAMLSPGILLVHHELLRLLREQAANTAAAS
jgi:hypothetical protein